MRHRRGKNRDAKDGSAVRRFCNRCNAEKQDNQPCKVCGCPEYRLGVTLVEVLCAFAILAILVSLAFGMLRAVRRVDGGPPPKTVLLVTVEHEGHWFIVDGAVRVCVHHPGCPCHRGRLKAEETANGR